eukprot:1156943-Pelagomonas_calceolata.AAC.2
MQEGGIAIVLADGVQELSQTHPLCPFRPNMSSKNSSKLTHRAYLDIPRPRSAGRWHCHCVGGWRSGINLTHPP